MITSILSGEVITDKTQQSQMEYMRFTNGGLSDFTNRNSMQLYRSAHHSPSFLWNEDVLKKIAQKLL